MFLLFSIPVFVLDLFGIISLKTENILLQQTCPVSTINSKKISDNASWTIGPASLISFHNIFVVNII
jgi:hypothetical protein